MADTKITALAAITTVDPAADVLPIVDISDTSMAASGTTKKITSNQILGSGGTATLASATITGALTGQSSASFYTGTALPLHIRNSGTSFTQIGDNGTIGAGTAFIVGSSDTSLRFQCGGSEQMRLNSTGLGVGVSPAFKIHANGVIGTTNTFGAFTALQTTGGTGYRWTLANDNNFYLQYSPDGFGSTATSRIALDSSGNVGIGVTPNTWTVYKALQVNSASVWSTTGNDTAYASNVYYDGGYKFRSGSSDKACMYIQFAGQHQWHYTASAGTAGNTAAFTQAMTLDASGNLLLACTSAPTGSTSGFYFDATRYAYFSRSAGETLNLNRYTSTGATAKFRYAGTEVGDISVTGAGTTYNSTSDYRLKESVAPLSGGLARVSALKPSIYKWKSDGSSGEGFLAHELAEVVPAAVTGEKDAVNEDGSIKAQSIDMSRIVPILVAAIQELTARVQTLETR